MKIICKFSTRHGPFLSDTRPAGWK